MCPPCKPIIDCGGVLVAALLRLADDVVDIEGLDGPTRRRVSSAARHYSRTVEGCVDAMKFAHANRDHPEVSFKFNNSYEKALERAHAFSELSCHRAKAIREFLARARAGVEHPNGPKDLQGVSVDLLDSWAEQHRLTITDLFGGEYKGEAWVIDGLHGIKPKVTE